MLRWSLLFGGLAVVLVALAFLAESAAGRVVAGWCALDATWLAAAYGGLGPRALGKSADGRLAPWTWVILAPYLAMNHIALRLVRRPERLHEIDAALFLGPRPAQRDRGAFEKAGIRSVLDLTCEFHEVDFARALPAYTVVPLLDATAPSPEQIERAVRWCAARMQDGSVYVHCAAGRGRSATIVAAVLLHLDKVPDAESAIARVRERHPSARPNSMQMAALLAWADQRGSS
jgi:predicted protein tyrosine phosphatase